MNVFEKYSKYYDLLYHNKNYKEESGFIDSIIKKVHPKACTIFDLGCGTGSHGFFLADLGYEFTGIDISEKMIDIAVKKKNNYNENTFLEFYVGDVRSFEINKKFDIITSLFHVFGYQNTNKDLHSTLITVKKHLKSDGFLIFDSWYGPAVISDKPVVRIKKHEDEKFSILRIAEPDFLPNDNIVKVRYTLFIKDKGTNIVEEFTEVHSVRYWFKPELEYICESVGLKLVENGEWLTGKELNFSTWNSYFIYNLKADI